MVAIDEREREKETERDRRQMRRMVYVALLAFNNQ